MDISFGVRKGAWSSEEDALLRKYVEQYGEGKWHQVPIRTGLNRCRKSCRLRWLNYLKPNIKRGDFSVDEVDLIIRLHKLLGNRWSLIAGRLPGRTANDVKNYWNTHLVKKKTTNKHYDLKVINRPIKITKANISRPRPQIFSKKIFWSNEENVIEVNNPNLNPNFTSLSPPGTAATPHAAEDNGSTWWERLLSLEDEKDEEIKARNDIAGSETVGGSNDGVINNNFHHITCFVEEEYNNNNNNNNNNYQNHNNNNNNNRYGTMMWDNANTYFLEDGKSWSIDDKISCNNNGCQNSSNNLHDDDFLFDLGPWDVVDTENNNHKIIM